jgi:two-component system LytT family response regulator
MSVNPVVSRLRCVIVDDQPNSVLDMMSMLEAHSTALIISETANTVDEAVEKVNRIRPDVLFLDVELGKDTGFDVIRRHQEPLPNVVFVSGMSHYSLQAIKANAVDYLLKPVDATELADVVAKCQALADRNRNIESLQILLRHGLQAKVERIVIPQENRLRVFELKDLVFIEGDGSYSRLVDVSGEKLLVSMSLHELEEKLGVDRFIRCHKSYLVNPDFIRDLWMGNVPELRLKTDAVLPVARRRLKEISDRLRRG